MYKCADAESDDDDGDVLHCVVLDGRA